MPVRQFVDTKKAGGKTLLHTLQQVVTTKFPEIEGFQQEIAGAVDAYKCMFVNALTVVSEMSQ